jgi:hypothetical protein
MKHQTRITCMYKDKIKFDVSICRIPFCPSRPGCPGIPCNPGGPTGLRSPFSPCCPGRPSKPGRPGSPFGPGKPGKPVKGKSSVRIFYIIVQHKKLYSYNWNKMTVWISYDDLPSQWNSVIHLQVWSYVPVTHHDKKSPKLVDITAVISNT